MFLYTTLCISVVTHMCYIDHREVNQRLTKALFVSLNTVMLASLSRLW